MKRISTFAAVAVTSVAIASSVGSTAFAWHPQGTITKSVQNVTANSAVSAADTATTAVGVKPGDILNYTIVVSNKGVADSKGYNDMAKTVMTDTLPVGIELVSNPSQRQITENLGLIKPGASVTKSYQVKVTSTADGAIIENKACFTGDSTANDNPQKGCDVADVKVTVPPAPVTPVTPVTPTPTTPVTTPAAATPAPIAAPAVLPSTGASTNLMFLAAGLASIAGYIVSIKRRANA